MEGKEEIEWSRWQPTKRQKEILEELFKEGHRNPSPSLIDHFTNLLKQYGNIEAKNVFYWFQNNHARNKRKQEKETHADNKRKQKKEARQMPQSRFVSTPRGLNDKDSVKILEGQTKADRTIVDSSKGMAEFSAQGDTNSPESASGISAQKLLPIDLQWKHHLQSVGIKTFSEPDDFTHKAAADAQDHEEKEELLELFPLHPDGNLKSKCNSSFQGDKETNNIRETKIHQNQPPVSQRKSCYQLTCNGNTIYNLLESKPSLSPMISHTNDRWVQHFTDRGGNNVMMNCSDAQDHEEKEELLELFPLHPDGNLKSKCNSSFQGDKETNNIRWGSGEWLSLKFVP